MKKILSLFAAAVMAVSMWATTASVTFSEAGYANGEDVIGENIGAVTAVFDKGTGNNAPKYYTTGSALRCYGGNTMTFASETVTITKIVFTFSSGEGTNAITANNGTFATNTWTGRASSVVLTVGGTSGHRRIASIEVTYEGGSAPAGYNGTVTASVTSLSQLSDLANLQLTFVGATTVTMVDEEELGGIYLQNASGSEVYAAWHPSLGHTCSINGNVVTLSGFDFTEILECVELPSESATLYFSDYGSFLADDYDDYFDDVEVAYEAAYNCPEAEVLSVSEAIAAADHACIATNDSISVYGWITKMEFKPSNFTRYGSVNIYVQDREGNEFEFYNCYSLNADTFQTVLPEVEDWTSTEWTQAAYIIDRHGNQINLGDSVVACGKFKKYNSTYELNTGCYLTYAPERLAPAAATFEDVEIGEGDYVYRPAAWETGNHAWTSGSWTLNTTVASWGGYTDIQVVNTLDTADTEGFDHYLVAAAAVVAEGNNYAVWNDNYGANAMVVNKAGASVVSGMAITNTYDAVESMKHGDAYAAGLKNEGDFFKLTVYGYAYNAENELVAVNTTVEFMLGEVKNGELVFAENWQWLDLSSLGEISAISFALTGSDTSYGFLNTPGYFCFDNLGGAAEDCELGAMSSFIPTALDNIHVNNVIKFIENGQLIIVKDGVRYNAMGAKL